VWGRRRSLGLCVPAACAAFAALICFTGSSWAVGSSRWLGCRRGALILLTDVEDSRNSDHPDTTENAQAAKAQLAADEAPYQIRPLLKESAQCGTSVTYSICVIASVERGTPRGCVLWLA